jgi:ABC-type uncharacterized transport system permease subunit
MLTRKADAGIAIAAAVLILLIIVGLSGGLSGLRSFFVEPVKNPYALGNLLFLAGILMLTGSGSLLSFGSGMFNLGGEGQAYAGAFIGIIAGLSVPGEGFLQTASACIAAFAAGAVIAGFSGILKNRYGLDELITTFLVSGASLPLIDYFITGPARDPDSYLLTTRQIGEAGRFPKLLPPSQLDAGFLIAAGLTLVFHLFRSYTLAGYRYRMTGLNRLCAAYSGIREGRYRLASLAVSGGIHALAGILLALGNGGRCLQGMTGGIGWNGIAVALIAGNSPLAVIPAALLFAYLDMGGKTALLASGFPVEMSTLMQGIVFILITARRVRS